MQLSALDTRYQNSYNGVEWATNSSLPGHRHVFIFIYLGGYSRRKNCLPKELVNYLSSSLIFKCLSVPDYSDSSRSQGWLLFLGISDPDVTQSGQSAQYIR